MSAGHNIGAGRLRSFIDRVLRLKEEQDTLAADIREVYAEAKGEGFDKTALGQVVAHLRKVDKRGADAVNEAETIFDMYLSAYQGGNEQPSRTHAYAREGHEVRGGTRDAGESATAAPLEDDEKSGPGESPGAAPQPVEALSEVALPTTDDDTGLSGSGRASGTGSAGGEGSTPSGAPTIPDDDIPAFVKKQYVLRPHCLHPENCAGYSDKHCHECTKSRSSREQEQAA